MLDLDINSNLLDTTGMLLLAMKESEEERLLEEVLSKRGSIFPSHCEQEVVWTKNSKNFSETNTYAPQIHM